LAAKLRKATGLLIRVLNTATHRLPWQPDKATSGPRRRQHLAHGCYQSCPRTDNAIASPLKKFHIFPIFPSGIKFLNIQKLL